MKRGWILGLMIALLVSATAFVAWRRGSRPASVPPSPPVTGDAGFLDFAGSGPARLDATALLALGCDPHAADAPALRLSLRGDTIPTLNRQTPQGWEVLFYVPADATRFSPYTTVRWERGVTSPPMTMRVPESATATPVETAYRTLHVEQDTRYLPQATAEVPWFWEALYAPKVWTPELSLPGWVSGPMTATVRLWSHSSSAEVNPDHVARLLWGEGEVQAWSWDGMGMQTFTAAWSPATLEPLRFETPAVEGSTAVVWLDSLTITYTARVEANGALWTAQGDALRVAKATAETLAWEVSDPLSPVSLSPWPFGGALATERGAVYWFGTPEQMQRPLGWRAAQALPELPADVTYLVIAPEVFHAALTPLLEARRSAGLTVALVSPQAVYDSYGDGRPDAQALRLFIQSLPALRYVLVVGDGSAAVEGYTGEAGALRVPTPYVRTFYVGETPADGLLGADAEGQPRVAVGRFPAQSVAEVEAMVAKTLAWEQSGAQQAIMVNDKESAFAQFIEALQPLTPVADPLRVDANVGDARTRLLERLNAAPSWVTYCGHGSLTQLSKEELLTFKDGWTQPAVFVSWTCLSAYFVHPQQEGLGEVWLRQPQGGVVAFLGPTGETTSGEQRPYAEAFYRALATMPRVGDAWVEALRQGGSEDARWSFVLLGDPALRVRP